MRRSALLFLGLSLVAFGCDAGALCASMMETAESCCCPVDGPSPCMEEGEGMPMPADERQATTDERVTPALLAEAAAGPWALDVAQDFPAAIETDAAAGTRPAAYLLACSFLC